MPDAHINIVRKGDPPPLPELDNYIHLPNASLRFVILEEGMSSGKCSVAIAVPLPDGTTVLAETSLAILSGAVIAGRAAFPHEFDGGPLHVRHFQDGD